MIIFYEGDFVIFEGILYIDVIKQVVYEVVKGIFMVGVGIYLVGMVVIFKDI